jgi:hypothetical protein
MIYSIFIIVFAGDEIGDNDRVKAIDVGLLGGWRGPFVLDAPGGGTFAFVAFVDVFGSLSCCIFVVVVVAGRCLISLC